MRLQSSLYGPLILKKKEEGDFNPLCVGIQLKEKEDDDRDEEGEEKKRKKKKARCVMAYRPSRVASQ